MKQESFSDMEYRCRKKKTKREEFLEIMDEIIPWDEWVSLIVPHYPSGKRGRPPIEIETMLRMYLLQCWFNLSDEGVEDAIYDSYAMRKFMGINFFEQDVPDATTLLHFRHLLEEKGIGKLFFDAINRIRLPRRAAPYPPPRVFAPFWRDGVWKTKISPSNVHPLFVGYHHP